MILIKFPTRERPEQFFNTLNQYILKANNIDNIVFLITLDANDTSMLNQDIIKRLVWYQKRFKLLYYFGESETKVEAVNCNMDVIDWWDIVILASDDMMPIYQGYDTVIQQDMEKNFSDTDGVLWYSDGVPNDFSTWSVVGKKYYDRFNFLYNPEYKSLWCDVEFTDVARHLDKIYKSDLQLVEHRHYSLNKATYDNLYNRNETFKTQDQATYFRRKEKNFDLLTI